MRKICLASFLKVIFITLNVLVFSGFFIFNNQYDSLGIKYYD